MSLLDSFRSKFTRPSALTTAVPAPASVAVALPPVALRASPSAAATTHTPPIAMPSTPSPAAATAAPPPPAPKVRRILFVDDDPDVLSRFRDGLTKLENGWEIRYAASGAEAVSVAGQQPFDAIVADMHMPGMNGVALFNEIMRKHPKILRFLRMAQEDRDQLKNCIGASPQHLATDIDPATLEASLERGFQLDTWMNDAAIKRLLPQLTKLPSMPTLYTQVTAELQSPSGSIENVARLIAQDPVMTAKMLQVVNSAFFALHREISDPNDAVMFLGAERTKSLIMLAKIFSQFDNTKCAGFAPDKLWGHSMNVGELARRIARSQGLDAKLCEMAFTAGLLHDVGKLLLAANLPGSYSQVLTDGKRKQISPSEAERAAYGTTHAEIGACLLGIWGLPLNILEAIAWHHAPRHGIHQRFSLLTAVHAANVLLYEMQKSPAETGAPPAGFDLEYLHSLGLADEVETWRGLVPGAE